MSTIREHLEDLRDIGEIVGSRAVTEHAVAALRVLDAAERLSLYYGSPEAHTWAVVPDPGPA